MPYEAYIPLSSYLDRDYWPFDRLQIEDTFLDLLAWRGGTINYDESGLLADAHLGVMAESSIDLGAGLHLVIGTGEAWGSLEVHDGQITARLEADALFLRLPRSLFVPVKEIDGILQPDSDPARFVEIAIPVAIEYDETRGFALDWGDDAPAAFTLPRCMIGNTGIVISAEGVTPRLSVDDPLPAAALDAGAAYDSIGLFLANATLTMPQGLEGLAPQGMSLHGWIGTGGFSGHAEFHWDHEERVSLGGVTFTPASLAVAFRQNALIESEVSGTLTLPFFDKPIDVVIGFGTSGSLLVRLAVEGGVIPLEVNGVLRFDLDAASFAFEQGRLAVTVSGNLQLIPLSSAKFRVRELRIDSDGNIALSGGWIDLREQQSLDFHGFPMEIARLGFGQSPSFGGKWIGLSGAIHLIDDLTAGVSVEGLRIGWQSENDAPRITLDGVGVELSIEDVIHCKGSVSYRELPHGHQFTGSMEVTLASLDNMGIYGTIVIGSNDGSPYFAIYLGVDLPTPIPLGATGLAIYGFDGLFALDYAPNREESEPWYRHPGGEGWYGAEGDDHISDLDDMWEPRRDSQSLGAGMIIGTDDDGYSFSAHAMLVISLPGPIIMFEGRANLMQPRANVHRAADFRCFAIWDGKQDTLLFALAAMYKYDKEKGRILDIEGEAEAFFDFRNRDHWHLYLGVDQPRSRRIHATFLTILRADCYFMFNPEGLRLGGWLGFDQAWSLGPATLRAAAWIEGEAHVSFKPTYFFGKLRMYGLLDLRVFGFGIGMYLDARIQAQVFDPFQISARLSAGIDLPWPLKHFEATVILEWSADTNRRPPLPAPLQDVAIAHNLTNRTWPLTSNFVLCDYTTDENFYRGGQASDLAAPPPANAPVIPLDAMPRLSFVRSVNDLTMQLSNASPARGEPVGDARRGHSLGTAQYALSAVELQRWRPSAVGSSTGTWETVTPIVPSGTWAPQADLPAWSSGSQRPTANRILLYGSRNHFEYIRHTGAEYGDWFGEKHPNWPCIPAPGDTELCCAFENYYLEPQPLASPWTCPDHSEIKVEWTREAHIADILEQRYEHALALCTAIPDGENGLPRNVQFHVIPSRPAKRIRVVVVDEDLPIHDCVDFRDRDQNDIDLDAAEIRRHGMRIEASESHIISVNGVTGLLCRVQVAVTLLESPVGHIDLLMGSSELPRPARIEVLDANLISLAIQSVTLDGPPETIAFDEPGIRYIIIHGDGEAIVLHAICFSDRRGSAFARMTDASGHTSRPLYAKQGVIDAKGRDITELLIERPRSLCLVEICITFEAAAQELDEYQQRKQLLLDWIAQWSRDEMFFDPYTQYRLRIATSASGPTEPPSSGTLNAWAFFRTEGPPGLADLSLPASPPVPDKLIETKSVLLPNGQLAERRVLRDEGSALTPYVKQTIPATVPVPGNAPKMARPVYRAYDVRVEFAAVVPPMYARNGRDLALYLFDSNNRPTRDERGRLFTSGSSWEPSDALTLSEIEKRWVDLVNGSGCNPPLHIDPETIPKNQALVSSGTRTLLDPGVVHEARVVPMRLHDDFSTYGAGTVVPPSPQQVGRWTAVDFGDVDPPSRWVLGDRAVEQQSAISGSDGLGTFLVCVPDVRLPLNPFDEPALWTDYRVSVFLRWEQEHAIGVVIRYSDLGNWYRVALDRTSGRCTLTVCSLNATTQLGTRALAFEPNRDYHLVVEAIAAEIRVFLDGELVIEATDASHAEGTIGLYTSSSAGARFKDVRCEDLRKTAPVVYRFPFTTSRFANFAHHIQSFEDETWRIDVPASAVFERHFGDAATFSNALSDAEALAYDSVANDVFGSAIGIAPRIEVSRIIHSGQSMMLHVASPEPLDWHRVDCRLTRTNDIPPARRAGALKITDVVLNAPTTNQEWVTLVARETIDLMGHRLYYRQVTSTAAAFDTPLSDWKTFHEFERKVVGAGRTVVVGSGSAAIGLNEPLAEVQYANAANPRLDATAIDLLLVTPDGQRAHGRRFVEGGTAVEFRCLRRRDGLGCFLTPNSLPLAFGTYRLTWTFQRDRVVEGSTFGLSEVGVRSPERTIIDVPWRTIT